MASRTAAPGKRNLVLIVLDGARPEYFSVPGIPHIRALMSQGATYTQAFAGLLESETPAGHASISTGSTPNRNGVLSFEWANSDNIPTSIFDPAKIQAHMLENIVKISRAPTIAGLVHKQNPKSAVVALGGSKYYANDALGGPNADVIMYYTGTPNGMFAPIAVPGHVPPRSVLTAPGLVIKNRNIPLGVGDHLSMKLALTTFQHMKPRVMMVNVPEFDWPLGHVYGAVRDMKDATTLMHGFDRDLGALEDAYRRAGMLQNTIFVVTADHGFSPIYHTVSDAAIGKAITSAGTSLLTSSFHTAAYLWLRDESRAVNVAANISHQQIPYIQSVYFRDVGAGGPTYIRASGPDLLRASGQEAANQYLLNTFNGPNGPDVVAFFTEEAASLPGGEAGWKGDHGGNSWQSQHIPLVISGPGVRRGYVASYPARLEDIAPTVLTLMGVPPAGMTGLPLADAMQHPSASLRRAQLTQSTVLRPVVASLQQESRLEVAAGQ